MCDVLPDEIIVNIFCHLDRSVLLRSVALVCKSWRQLVSDNSIWKNLYIMEFLVDNHQLGIRSFLSRFICLETESTDELLQHYSDIQNDNWAKYFKFKYDSEQKWRMKQFRQEVYCGHQGWVRTLDFKDDILYSGSNDTTIM